MWPTLCEVFIGSRCDVARAFQMSPIDEPVAVLEHHIAHSRYAGIFLGITEGDVSQDAVKSDEREMRESGSDGAAFRKNSHLSTFSFCDRRSTSHSGHFRGALCRGERSLAGIRLRKMNSDVLEKMLMER